MVPLGGLVHGKAKAEPKVTTLLVLEVAAQSQVSSLALLYSLLYDLKLLQ